MKNYNKFLCCILLFVFSISLIGCSTNESKKEETDVQPNSITATESIEIDDGSGTKKLINYKYYTVDFNTGEIISAMNMIDDDQAVTAELIMSSFEDSLEDSSLEIKIDEVIEEGDTIYISFDDGIEKLAEDNDMLEYAILDAAAQSILDNLDSCKKVGFRIMGKAYKTKNLSFGLNEIYMDK